MKPTFAIVGCGKVGVTLARHLGAAGYRPAAFASRAKASARAAAEAAGGGRVCREAWEATADADVVFITTPDGLIGTVAQALADHSGVKPGAVVLHCSGALASTVLAPLGGSGAHAGSLHPLQSFAAPVLAHNPFKGIVLAAEGDDTALALCREVAGALEAEFLTLETDNKVLYHAAAVVASNYLVTLLAVATRLLEGSGIPSEAASRCCCRWCGARCRMSPNRGSPRPLPVPSPGATGRPWRPTAARSENPCRIYCPSTA